MPEYLTLSFLAKMHYTDTYVEATKDNTLIGDAFVSILTKPFTVDETRYVKARAYMQPNSQNNAEYDIPMTTLLSRYKRVAAGVQRSDFGPNATEVDWLALNNHQDIFNG